MRKILTILGCSFATFVCAQTTVVHDGTPSGTAVGNHAIINQGTTVTPAVPQTPQNNSPTESTKTNQGFPVNQPKKPIDVPQKQPIVVPQKGSASPQ